MTDEKQHLSKGNDEADIDKDPEAKELEIDHANDEMGGPTTESLNAGLASALQSSGSIPGQAAGRDTGDVDRNG